MLFSSKTYWIKFVDQYGVSGDSGWQKIMLFAVKKPCVDFLEEVIHSKMKVQSLFTRLQNMCGVIFAVKQNF